MLETITNKITNIINLINREFVVFQNIYNLILNRAVFKPVFFSATIPGSLPRLVGARSKPSIPDSFSEWI